jgi:hypothetical protein
MPLDTYEGPALFHVGYLKTASTYLQHAVFSNPDFGCALAAGRENRGHIMDWFRTADAYLFDPAAVARKMAQLEAPVRAAGLIPVWSEETFLGDPLKRNYDGAWMLEKLAATGRPLRILFTIRRQAGLALSAYREFLKLNRNGLTDFIGTGDEPRSHRPILHPEFLCFDIAVARWRAVFGAENVLVLPKEILDRDAAAYLGRLAAFLGRDSAPAAPTQSFNVGLGGTALVASRGLNALVVRSPLDSRRSLAERAVGRVKRGIDRLSPRALDKIIERRWTSAIEARYAGLFDSSNRHLKEMTGLDLGALGYPVADRVRAPGAPQER